MIIMSKETNSARYSKLKMVKVSYLYYKRGLNQKEIASQLGVSTNTISRILNAAKKSGVLEFNLKYKYGRNAEIEEKSEQAYPSVRFVAYEDDFLSTSQRKESAISNFLGEAFSTQLETFISKNSLVGIGGGKTVSALVRNLRKEDIPELQEVVQLIGSFGTEVIAENSASVIHKLCDKLGISGTFLLSKAIQEKSMESTQSYSSQIQEKWGNIDTAILGIGEVAETATVMKTTLFDTSDLHTLKTKGAVGNIGLHFYNTKGELVDLGLDSRIAGISCEQLEETKQVIVIAGGQHKNKAILGALNSGLVDVVVTLVGNLQYVLKRRRDELS